MTSLWTKTILGHFNVGMNLYYDPGKMKKVSKDPLYQDFNESFQKTLHELRIPFIRFQSYHSGAFVVGNDFLNHNAFIEGLPLGKNKPSLVQIHIETFDTRTEEVLESFTLHWSQKGLFR